VIPKQAVFAYCAVSFIVGSLFTYGMFSLFGRI
jgi:hypothetical protein